ncbi:Uncharacterised protein [Legionella quateirensis]|uniref:Uncharacterized protein n=1 Tax=Legionella quateirensis TaxID=45072 RepID=A0A378L039_9GAMM|nr:Uncharacterised protein [Legionella quateirensis]
MNLRTILSSFESSTYRWLVDPGLVFFLSTSHHVVLFFIRGLIPELRASIRALASISTSRQSGGTFRTPLYMMKFDTLIKKPFLLTNRS